MPNRGLKDMAAELLKQNRFGCLPKWYQLGVPRKRWPLHLKDVAPVHQRLLTEMIVMDLSLKEDWSKSLRWIQEEPEGVAKGQTVEAKLTAEGVKRMCAIGQAEETIEAEVRATVNVFPVEERAKERERVIKHTKPFNERYGRDTLLGLKLLRAKDLVGTVHDGKYCITLDFSAWFDQHEIATKVRPWFCFFFEGKWYRLCRLPMGMRQAVDIADTATRIIASFPVPAGVRVDTYVDNIRFLGDCLDDVVAAATEFVRRAHHVNATINEVSPSLKVDVEKIKEELKKLVKTSGEFLGIHFDYINKVVKVGAKALVKLVALKEVFDHGECTHRNLLAIFGVLFFALQATGAHACRRYYALREYSDASRLLQKDPGRLESLWKCSPSRLSHIKKWIEDVLANTPVMVAQKVSASDAEYIIVVDASGWGWGAILVNQRTGSIRTWNEPWNKGWVGARKSAWSEPEGAKRAILHFFPEGTSHSIGVLSDSSTAVGAYTKGHSMKFAVNRAIVDFETAFQSWNVRWYHIAGVLNCSDGESRGMKIKAEDLEATARQVRCLVLGLPREEGPISVQ